MLNPEYLLIIIFAIFIVFLVGIYLYTTVNKNLQTSNIAKEVFVVNAESTDLLDSGKLKAPYKYAKAFQIEDAVSRGLRIEGVKTGDYIAYLSVDPEYDDVEPNFYIAQEGDYSTNINVRLPVNSDKGVNDKKHNFYIFLYGYKPLEILKDYEYFVNLNGFIHEKKTLPFDASKWNDPSPKDVSPLTEDEVFLVQFKYVRGTNPLKDMIDMLKTTGSYNVANFDQIGQFMSKGLSFGVECKNVIFDNVGNAYCCHIPLPTYYYSTCEPKEELFYDCKLDINTYKETCFVWTAIYGNKKLFPKEINYPGFSKNIVVEDFNKNKKSFYE